jgi:N-acetylglucosaminyldiphosphoundecaprenol N-acetyl-beta-D-mannosaminyltransferase
MWNILRIAEEEQLPVFLLANESGLSSWQETAAVIKKKFPKLRVGGANMGEAICYFDSKKKRNICNMKTYQILFSNFGAPEQDKFIASLKDYDNDLKLAMGVGGSFDFISGKITRAPKWARRIGLEWLWRLMMQPKRIGRIIKSVVIFPIRILINR